MEYRDRKRYGNNDAIGFSSLLISFVFLSCCVTEKESQFKDLALQSGLVTVAQIREAISALEPKQGRQLSADQVSGKELASLLVGNSVLTTYQAEQILAGRTRLKLGAYIVTDWIAQGGMGQVFKAVHEMLGRECAIKVLPMSKATPESIANFRREIRTQAQLDHPNLVRAFDAGEDGNVHFLVVEYVPGTDLRQLIHAKKQLDVQQAANVIMQAAKGLANAHSYNLIHRDIKPGNILVTPEGVAKVSDLGLAGYLNDSDDPRAGKTVGTADYLSPEQITSPQDITKASDIYSLGCTLYYVVTGKVPYPGGNAKNKARRHLEETPWHPRRFNKDVSDDFVDLIGDMMEKDPTLRIQSAEEVVERLAPWASDNSPLLETQVERSRWMPPPVPGDHDESQDTDPANDVASMALNEISGLSGSSQSASHSRESLSPGPPAPPIAINTVSGRYQQAGHVDDGEPKISITLGVVIGIVCAFAGAVVGFFLGYMAG